jgi:Flp pilus assembly protein TadG
MRSIRAKLQALKTSRRGSAAFEFAVISPLLVSFVFGALEFGFVLFSYSSMQLAADIAAREVSVNTAAAAGISAKVKDTLPAWLHDAVTVTVTQTDTKDARKNLISVTVTAPADKATPMPMFTKAYSWTLTTNVSVVQELPF